MAWRQLSVLSRYPEFVEEILLAHGALSVSFFDAGDDPVLEPAPGETPLWPRTRTVGLFDQGAALDPVVDALRETLPDGKQLVATSAALEDEEWARMWLRDWKPLKFGDRLWVCPHEQAVEEPGTVTVRLDPGLAFGTGTHPSTALCLDWLARADLAGKQVLDYGCGSGLLAIAALKLGAARARAVDIDPQAVTATTDNARQNRVADRIRASLPDEAGDEPCDIVIANILAQPLIELAPRLLAAMAPGGTIVLAGLLTRHSGDVMRAYANKITFEEPLVREDWVRLTGRSLRS